MSHNNNEFGKYISLYYRNFQIYLNKQLAALDLSSAEYPFIISLKAGLIVNQSFFNECFSLDPGLITRSLKTLEEKGFVVRKQDAQDKRNILVELTNKGIKVKPKIKKIILDWEHIVFEGYDEQSKNVLQDKIKAIALNAQQINKKKVK